MIEDNKYSEYPKILVISNNAFSSTSNNGKTLASFFKEIPEDRIAQLYFSDEIPSNDLCSNYFRITDKEVLKRNICRTLTCGKKIIIDSNVTKISQGNNDSIVSMLKKYNISRITREVFWANNKWNTKILDKWLEEFNPELIFLCAGDSGFAYDITEYIQNKFSSKLVVYITDDYVLPRKTLSIFWWLRRNFILKKMEKSICKSNMFITISQQMKETYKKLFGVDSILAVNMTESLKEEYNVIQDNNKITLVYTGGLHYKRYKTLNLLAKALKKYNLDINNKKKVYLKIYSLQEPSKAILKDINIEGASEFCGKLNSFQIKKVLNTCNILVHVESFDKKSIESTRLSISTKIPEYLSLGKPVLAIGPKEVASMEYLKDSAFCINDPSNIYFHLKKMLDDEDMQVELALKALSKYQDNHDAEKVYRQFMSKLIYVCEGKLI